MPESLQSAARRSARRIYISAASMVAAGISLAASRLPFERYWWLAFIVATPWALWATWPVQCAHYRDFKRWSS